MITGTSYYTESEKREMKKMAKTALEEVFGLTAGLEHIKPLECSYNSELGRWDYVMFRIDRNHYAEYQATYTEYDGYRIKIVRCGDWTKSLTF